MIKALDNSIDLEGFAHHRSSLFGGLGLRPVSQKKFESRLWTRLNDLANKEVVFIVTSYIELFLIMIMMTTDAFYRIAPPWGVGFD